MTFPLRKPEKRGSLPVLALLLDVKFWFNIFAGLTSALASGKRLSMSCFFGVSNALEQHYLDLKFLGSNDTRYLHAALVSF